jgi:hypothetical protein
MLGLAFLLSDAYAMPMQISFAYKILNWSRRVGIGKSWIL